MSIDVSARVILECKVGSSVMAYSHHHRYRALLFNDSTSVKIMPPSDTEITTHVCELAGTLAAHSLPVLALTSAPWRYRVGEINGGVAVESLLVSGTEFRTGKRPEIRARVSTHLLLFS